MLTTPEFHDASRDVDLEGLPHDPLDMPPLLFPPSPLGRGRALDAALPRLPPHTRAHSHSPQASYSNIDINLLSRHNSDLEYLRNPSRFDNEPAERYLPHPGGAMEDFLDESLMASHYLDLPNQCSTVQQDAYIPPYPRSDSSVSSPEATDTASLSPSPRAGMFSVQSSPGYFVNELPGPEGLETARPHSGFGRHPRTPHYPNHYGHYSQTDNSFTDSLVLPRPASYHELSIVQRPPSHWGYPQSALPGALPSISQNSRHTSARPPSPPDAHVMNEFNATQFPVAEDVRRWPQMFKINQVKKGGAKKQMMACLFCRERKIGCTRPAEHEPDQTCNQCARRKRECVYPTESRRGQHTRNRLSSKKFLGLDELKLPLVTPPKLPGTE